MEWGAGVLGVIVNRSRTPCSAEEASVLCARLCNKETQARCISANGCSFQLLTVLFGAVMVSATCSSGSRRSH
jgi:hypothetical protein